MGQYGVPGGRFCNLVEKLCPTYYHEIPQQYLTPFFLPHCKLEFHNATAGDETEMLCKQLHHEAGNGPLYGNNTYIELFALSVILLTLSVPAIFYSLQFLNKQHQNAVDQIAPDDAELQQLLLGGQDEENVACRNRENSSSTAIESDTSTVMQPGFFGSKSDKSEAVYAPNAKTGALTRL